MDGIEAWQHFGISLTSGRDWFLAIDRRAERGNLAGRRSVLHCHCQSRNPFAGNGDGTSGQSVPLLCSSDQPRRAGEVFQIFNRVFTRGVDPVFDRMALSRASGEAIWIQHSGRFASAESDRKQLASATAQETSQHQLLGKHIRIGSRPGGKIVPYLASRNNRRRRDDYCRRAGTFLASYVSS